MQEYQTAQNNFSEKSRDLVKAQVLLVNPAATDQEVRITQFLPFLLIVSKIERAIEVGPEQLFAMDRRRAAQESYDYIQSRHNEILKIEKSLEVCICIQLQALWRRKKEKLMPDVGSASDVPRHGRASRRAVRSD